MSKEMNKFITPENKMYSKLKGKHTWKKRGKLQATIPDGTVCEITRITEDRGHLILKYDDPTDNKTKYLKYCMHAHADHIEIIEGDI